MPEHAQGDGRAAPWTLTFPLSLFQEALRRLARSPDRAVDMEVGTVSAGPGSGWLVRSVVPDQLSGPRRGGRVVRLTDGELSAPVRPGIAGVLQVGSNGDQIVRGTLEAGDRSRPIERLFLPGPGMHRFRLPLDPRDASPPLGDPLDTLRWSRTIGALGGADVWLRLVSLRVAVVGCGRTGSIVASNLVRLGVRTVVLVDPDRIETHNLGEMQEVGVAALGEPKVSALAACLQRTAGEVGTRILPFVSAAAAKTAMEGIQRCDVIVSCSDNDAARLTAAIIATLNHKVLIDVGTGVFVRSGVERSHEAEVPSRIAGSTAGRTMGADVRMIVPGDGCILCRGGLSDFAQAVEDICQRRAHLDPIRAVSSRRAGSLHSLNQIAAGLATRMLEDLVAERLPGSRWVHLEFDDRGNVLTRYPYVPTPAATSECRLCARAGMGDDGF